MLINMWIRSNTGHRGFKLNFTSNEPTICVGDFNDNEGSIQTPVNETFSCHYKRENNRPFFLDTAGKAYGTLALKISTMENSIPLIVCTPGINLPIKISYLDSTFVKRKCLNDTENVLEHATPFPSTNVQIRLNPWIKSSRIDYKLHPCGEKILNQTLFTIQPPALNASYGAIHCVWFFSAMQGMKVKVNMNFDKLNCEKEYVNIFNGGSNNNPLIERVCGIQHGEKNFSSSLSGEKVLIEYHSEQYNPETSFNIKIDATYDLCGGLLVAPYFRFESPRNGSQYPSNVECTWQLRARPGYHVGLSFVDRFFVEESANCTNDYVTVYDKTNNSDYSVVAKLCGRSVDKSFNASADEMMVLFRTNDRIAADGFTAVWSENCGGVFTATANEQSIVSPRYPDNYPPNSLCNYTILAPSDSFINIRFDDFELEDSLRGCIFDNLTIFVRSNDWSTDLTLLGSYCRKDSLTMIRNKHQITIIFKSDQWLEKRGFRLHYSLDNCGGDIRSTTMVSLPINPETKSYMDELRCVWNITAPDDKHIVVRFETIDLEQNDYCYQDFVEVYEGSEIQSDNRKAHLCGNLTHHAPTVKIAFNKAVMRFQSDASIAAGGFSALILFVPKCDKNILLTEAVSTYHLDETSTGYQDMLDCHYQVKGPDGWVVKMEFTEFHVAGCQTNTSSSCNCDFVEVRDGAGPFAEPIGETRCGHVLPIAVTSTHSSLWVRFSTGKILNSNFILRIFFLISLFSQRCFNFKYRFQSSIHTYTFRMRSTRS